MQPVHYEHSTVVGDHPLEELKAKLANNFMYKHACGQLGNIGTMSIFIACMTGRVAAGPWNKVSLVQLGTPVAQLSALIDAMSFRTSYAKCTMPAIIVYLDCSDEFIEKISNPSCGLVPYNNCMSPDTPRVDAKSSMAMSYEEVFTRLKQELDRFNLEKAITFIEAFDGIVINHAIIASLDKIVAQLHAQPYFWHTKPYPDLKLGTYCPLEHSYWIQPPSRSEPLDSKAIFIRTNSGYDYVRESMPARHDNGFINPLTITPHVDAAHMSTVSKCCCECHHNSIKPTIPPLPGRYGSSSREIVKWLEDEITDPCYDRIVDIAAMVGIDTANIASSADTHELATQKIVERMKIIIAEWEPMIEKQIQADYDRAPKV